MKQESPRNHLHEQHYRNPVGHQSTMTTRQLRDTLLATGGFVLACGASWDVKHRYLGAGVNRVWLAPRSAGEP